MPLCLASRARSMASIERGVLSGPEWTWMSITPFKFDCAWAAKAKRLKQRTIQTERLAASCRDVEFISFSFFRLTWLPHAMKSPRSESLQERAQFAQALHIFKSHNFIDERRGGCGAEDRSHQVAGFPNDLLAGHRIRRRAAHGRNV